MTRGTAKYFEIGRFHADYMKSKSLFKGSNVKKKMQPSLYNEFHCLFSLGILQTALQVQLGKLSDTLVQTSAIRL